VCVTCGTADELGLVRGARLAADAILLGDRGARLRKAMDLSTPGGFDQAVAGMAAELRGAVSATDEAAVRAAVHVLDVDWHQTTAAQRRRLVAEALEAAGRRTGTVVRAVATPFGEAAEEVVTATRAGVRGQQGLRIAADFNALDQRITRHLVKTQANFVRDDYGRRLDTLGEEARRIVAEGLEAGLGREDIAADLQRAAEHAIVTRPAFYWEVVAGAFIANGRSLAQVSAFAEAGIQRYVIEAVLDEVTTETCRFLHGKVFSVGDAIKRFERIEEMDRPEDIKAAQPWVRQALDPETGQSVLFVERDGTRTPIAEVSRSGLGSKDDVGEFAHGRTERELMDLGVSFPPFHGLCRTTLLPDI